ncbi:hypothetical protein N9J88_03145 [Porticoccaceae bacterium]|nr:hypothetical protein [Porticoccaceae bacterium]
MTQGLKKRIQDISSEVVEMHPFLEEIFRKMPSIEKVEYTHGSHEMGADFILTRISKELGDTEYIGVIVKVGKITQSTSSIETQIEECMIKRISCNANKLVYLNEIWVTINGNISENAKIKIYSKYKAQKIKFIDLNKITDLAEEYFPSYGIDIPVSDITFLSKQSEERAQREELYRMVTNIENRNYIDQDIVRLSESSSEKEQEVDIFKEILSSKIVYIESQMGGGKTCLLNRIVEFLSDLNVYKDQRIVPIYFSCKDVFVSNNSLMDLVGVRSSEYNLVADDRRRFLILVDGLDEIKAGEVDISRKLQNMMDEAMAESQLSLLVCGRDTASYNLRYSSNYKINRFRIKPLNLESVFKLLKSICGDLNYHDRLFEDLKTSDLFRVLPKTPIAMIILARLMSEGNEELPLNLTELYAKYCELSLGRWDVVRGLSTQKEFDALDALVSIISSYMLDNGLPSVSKKEVENIFSSYLLERNLDLNASLLFQKMLDRSDILIENKLNETICFKHRSFAEFFYSKFLLSQQNVVPDERVFNSYWRNSYFFYVGLKRDCPQLLNEIIDIPVNTDFDRFLRISYLGQFLLAGYQSPYHVIERGVRSVFQDAGKFYCELNERQIESDLRKLSPIHLLVLFKFYLEQGYSFTFLRKAIEVTIEDCYTSPDMFGGVQYSLFFMDCIRHGLGGTPLFEDYIHLYKDELPEILQVAIGSESRSQNYTSPAIKKVQKRIRKNMQRSPAFRGSIEKLFGETINGDVIIDMKAKKLERPR